MVRLYQGHSLLKPLRISWFRIPSTNNFQTDFLLSSFQTTLRLEQLVRSHWRAETNYQLMEAVSIDHLQLHWRERKGPKDLASRKVSILGNFSNRIFKVRTSPKFRQISSNCLSQTKITTSLSNRIRNQRGSEAYYSSSKWCQTRYLEQRRKKVWTITLELQHSSQAINLPKYRIIMEVSLMKKEGRILFWRCKIHKGLTKYLSLFLILPNLRFSSQSSTSKVEIQLRCKQTALQSLHLLPRQVLLLLIQTKSTKITGLQSLISLA